MLYYLGLTGLFVGGFIIGWAIHGLTTQYDDPLLEEMIRQNQQLRERLDAVRRVANVDRKVL